MRESFKSFLCGLVAVMAGILLIATFREKLPWIVYVLIAIFLKEVLYFAVKQKPLPESVKAEMKKPSPEPIKAEVKESLPEPAKAEMKKPLPEPAKKTLPELAEEEKIEGPWEFEFVLCDEIKRKRVLEHVKPRYSRPFTYSRLNLAYGVVDKNHTINLTFDYYDSNVMRDSVRYPEYYDCYVVLTENNASFSV